MAITYESFYNSPCVIGRGATGLGAADAGGARVLRVGGLNTPPPAGAGPQGSYDNPAFFEKLKAAARQLIGATTDAQLSAAVIPNFLFNVEPTPAWAAVLAPVFPNGRLLEIPFFESLTIAADLAVTATGFRGILTPSPLAAVMFENAGANAPRYVDIGILVYGAEDNAIYTLKIFHSLTA